MPVHCAEWCKNWSWPPHGFFGPTKTVELGGPKRCLCRKKLVELRRFDGCCGEHGVCLPAMVDLVLEEMHEQAVAPSVCTSVSRLTRAMPPRRSGVSVLQTAIKRLSIAA